ncbi:hypothetical protein IWX90DRAFT_77639 [Phyllosticta citrichinensis]|uniref:Uncharacterized protein n=1 Tax=Phyllosticta citrichinensis TaxID=1130410 RepID=A0ABR1XGX0_9PEZI
MYKKGKVDKQHESVCLLKGCVVYIHAMLLLLLLLLLCRTYVRGGVDISIRCGHVVHDDEEEEEEEEEEKKGEVKKPATTAAATTTTTTEPTQASEANSREASLHHSMHGKPDRRCPSVREAQPPTSDDKRDGQENAHVVRSSCGPFLSSSVSVCCLGMCV